MEETQRLLVLLGFVATLPSGSLGFALAGLRAVRSNGGHVAAWNARHIAARDRASAPLLSSVDDPEEPAGKQEESRPLALEAVARSAVDSLTGGKAAEIQFMITQNMRAKLEELGYSAAEVNAMEPSRAATIIELGTPNSKRPQAKPKTKRERFDLLFTCNVCEAPNSHSISRHAYTKGTVIVTCPGCNSTHLIADNLNWIEDDFKNLEEAMAKRGTPVRRIVNDGVAASAASQAMAVLRSEGGEGDGGAGDGEGDDDAAGAPQPSKAKGGDPRKAATVVGRIDGIDEDQALRIREAVRAAKRKRREEPEP